MTEKNSAVPVVVVYENGLEAPETYVFPFVTEPDDDGLEQFYELCRFLGEVLPVAIPRGGDDDIQD